MTRIRDLLISLRAKRVRQMYNNSNDTVSFDAFCNDNSTEEIPKIKESSLTVRELRNSRIKTDTDRYERFSDAKVEGNSCFRPSPVTAFVMLLILMAVLLPPIICLLVFFNFLPDWNHILSAAAHKNDATHYSPSVLTRQVIDNPHVISEHTLSYNDKHILKELPPPPAPDYNQCKKITTNMRFDCHPEAGANTASCEARGCCWIPAKKKLKLKDTFEASDTLNIPYCFYPSKYGGYKYLNVTKTAYGLDAYLKRTFKSPYPHDIEVVKMIVKFETETRLHVKLLDPNHARFEPPYPEIPIVDRAWANISYSFVIDPLKTGFKVIRKSDETIIFNSMNIGALIFSDQFLQLSAVLPSNYIYGLGEHRSKFLLSTKWQRHTLFNVDQLPIENSNLYGSHPFYLNIEPSGKTHGVFLLNSNAMDVILQPSPAITFRPIGGVLDLFFLLGPTPSNVVQQYTDIVGKPFMPPQWGLGFHLCRFGYNTLNETKKVWKRTVDAGIPLDVQWNDLDYMSSNNDFTFNVTSFGGLPGFVKELHALGMHYIPLVDAGVSGSEPTGTYPPYDTGIEMDIFVKNSSGLPFIGKVWNRGTTVWPDFTYPPTVDYWTLMLRSMHNNFAFDGAWIDMNEPSNFLSGSTTGCPQSPLENPPYVPGVQGGQLNHKTMCMTAQHSAGLHYNVHNLFGFTEAIITNFAMAEIRGKRPFVISRSSFSGLGHYAGHWSGDVYSTWYDMKYTIPELLSFSLFGVPLMGADICGFNGNTTASLCNRWMQLGAFYPFSRNHNTDDGIDQDPVAMGTQVVESSKKALKVRYALLPYLYTLFWRAHTQGDTVARPLFFEFINDEKTYAIDDEFLWGGGLLITPVLEENKTSVNPYFPTGLWYNYYTYEIIASNGSYFPVAAPLDTIPLFVRGGYVLPQQEPSTTTHVTRKSLIQILAAADSKGEAKGHLYWDDGESLNSVEELKFSLLNFTLRPGELRTNVMWWGTEQPPNLGKVTILGVFAPVSSVTVNQIVQSFSYNTISKFLLIDNLNVTMKNAIHIEWK